MSRFYLLDGHNPVPVEDMMEWSLSAKLGCEEWRVASTMIDGSVWLSTVFLGLDHSFSGGAPMLFETLIQNDYGSDVVARYSTWEEAEDGHAAYIADHLTGTECEEALERLKTGKSQKQ